MLYKLFKYFQNEYKLIKEPGHGELTGSVTGLGLIELPENSQIIFENIMVPRNLLYEVLIRYQVNYFRCHILKPQCIFL